MISKTFSGARSRGLITVLVPVSWQYSTISSSCSVLSPLKSDWLLPEVRLTDDALFVGCVEFEDISEAIKAAFTCGPREFQASKIDAGSKGDGKEEDSSLD